MTNRSRAALLAVAIATGFAVTGGAASAAATGPFSPLKPVTVAEGGGVELATYGHWGRRCYRECHRGWHGRLHCSWECYRPRRWW